MSEISRVYNVPLRKEWLKVPLYKRAPKAIKALNQFLIKHMKSENIKLSKEINEKMWEKGIKSPPHHIKIEVVKDDKGVVKAELFGIKKKTDKKSKKVSKKSEKINKKSKETSEKEKVSKKELKTSLPDTEASISL